MAFSGARVLVVGAGIVGRSIAYFLRRSGALPTLIESATGPSDASRASLGVLTHFSGGESTLALFYRDSHALHRPLAEQLHEETGIDVGWRALGGLDLILDEADEERAESLFCVGREKGIAVERFDEAEVRACEENLAPAVRGGVFFPGDERVDPLPLGHALLEAAVGAEVYYGERLLRIVDSGANGVEVLTSRQRRAADFLVLACGAWTAELVRDLGAVLTLRPVRGQHIRYDGVAMRHVLRHGGHLLVPGAQATFVGATVEDVGFAVETTAAAAQTLAEAYGQVLMGRGHVQAQCAGLRSKARNGRPIIGPLSEHPRVFVAAGHYKNGVLMGPLTGQILTDWMLAGDPGREMSPFVPER